MTYRPYYLAREWVRLGHRVCIVASAESHLRLKKPQLADQDRMEENIDGVEYIWLQTPDYSGSGIGRVRNIAAFVRGLYRHSKQLAGSFKPDLVIASSTYAMEIWPAHRIAKLAKAKLVFEVRDLWPLTPMELGGMSKWHPFIMLVQAAEDYAYRHAEIVVSVLPKVHEYMVSRGMAPHKLHIVPNGIDLGEWVADSPDLQGAIKEELIALKTQGVPIIGYAGNHGVANALDTLIDTAKLMREENAVFVIVGDGQNKAALQQRVQTDSLKNVLFFDSIKKEQVPALLKYFDVAYIGWRRQPLYRFGISPNKLMDYMMAARPVLHSVEAGNDPVHDARCGMTVNPEDPQAIAQGIRTLLALSQDERCAMGQRGKDFVLNNHVYPVLAQRFLTACDS